MAKMYFEVVTSFICAGQYAAIKNHFSMDDSETTSNLFTDAEKVILELETSDVGPGDSWPILLTELLSADTFISAIRARAISPTPGPTAVRVFTSIDYPGSWSGDLDAFQTSGNITWPAQSQGPRRGTSHIPGVASDALVNNRFVLEYQEAVADLVEQAVYGFGNNTAKLIMEIKYGPNASPSFDPIQGGYLSPTPGHIKARRIPV